MTCTDDFRPSARQVGRDLHIEIGATELLTQRVPSDCRPYLHPLRTPDGRTVLTEDAPPHHPWQHGLYTGLRDVDGEEFWTEGAADGHIRGELGPVVCDRHRVRWRVDSSWTAADGRPVLSERQGWSLRATPSGYQLDLDWTLSAERVIRIGTHAYGGLFLRMPVGDPGLVACLNSEGAGGRDAEGRRARWVALSLPLGSDARPAGLAICDHPDNPDHPQAWRIDGQYGVGPSRSILGDWLITPTDPARARYRILPFLGGIDAEAIDTRCRAFATEATESES